MNTIMNRIKNLYPVKWYLRRRYDRRFASATRSNLFRGVFPDFASAAASMPGTKPLGYDNPVSAKLYEERRRRVYPADYPLLFWLARLLNPGCTLYEIGGHLGVAYFGYQQYLQYPQDLRWHIFEVPAVVAAGDELVRESGNSHLAFTTKMPSQQPVQILLAAGSLQYFEEDLAEMLTRFSPKPASLLLNLTPVNEKPTYYTLQNIGTAFCPYKIINEKRLIENLEKLGYVLKDQWANPEKRCFIPFVDESYSLTFYKGYYLSLESSPAPGV